MALTKVTKELIQGGLGVDWQATVKTGNFQAVASQGYFVNTTSNQVIVTMPPTASVGDIVSIVDYAGTAQTNNITITAQSNINGSANDVKIDYQRGAVSIIYSGTIQGWVAEFAANDGTDALVNLPSSFLANYLVVAGGAGSGSNFAGGSGAGGLRTSYGAETGGSVTPAETALSLSKAIAYTITIGVGGAGAPNGTNQIGDNGDVSSISGSDITDITTVGGGRGDFGGSGSAGGSIGGSGGGHAAANGSGYAGTAGQGKAGGNTATGSNGGTAGGGGSTGVGGNSVGGGASGPGGAGLAVAITGTSLSYAGGGGGGTYNNTSTSNIGGLGGGGNGGVHTIASGVITQATSGVINTGGGGGGGAAGGGLGGNGGSGIVILRYPTVSVSSFAVTGTLDTTANTAYPITNKAYYKLNGNANDSSGNGYNGTATSVTYAAGRFGQAAVFNGSNSYIDLPASINTSYFTPSSSWSISIWGNSSSLSSEGMLFGIDPLQNNEILVTVAGKVQWRIYNSSYEYLNSTTTVSINQWYHVVVTYSNGTMKLYVNAVNEASGTKTLVQSTYAPNIGRKQNSSAYFNGSIDQVRIFNSALSAGNVTSLYNEGTVVESTDGTDSILQFIGGTGNITFS